MKKLTFALLASMMLFLTSQGQLDPNSPVTPVTGLKSFKAEYVKDEHLVKFNWTTLTETNNKQFELYETSDTLHPIAIILTRTLDGNSALPIHYGYAINLLKPANSYEFGFNLPLTLFCMIMFGCVMYIMPTRMKNWKMFTVLIVLTAITSCKKNTNDISAQRPTHVYFLKQIDIDLKVGGYSDYQSVTFN